METINSQNETLMSLTVEIFLPFIVAGYGMVGAGVVLDIVQHWTVFEQINELFILVPALLGLKGNLEMTLASRLSTQVILVQVHNLAPPDRNVHYIIGSIIEEYVSTFFYFILGAFGQYGHSA